MFVCKIKNDDSVSPVLVRLYGGNVLPRDAPIRTLTEVTETLLFYKLGELGYGAKLLGSFDGGRLEEFLVGTTMSLEDYVTNPNVSRALAKVMARYHRINLPLIRKPWDIADISNKCLAKFKQVHPEFAGCYQTRGQNLGEFERVRSLVEFDAVEFTDWICKVLSAMKTRIVFTHNDANRSNIIVKGSPPDLDAADLDQRLLLIDCEFSGYSYRGQDIGNAFCMRKFDFAGEKFISGYEYPDEDDRRQYVEAYVEEMRNSGHYSDWDEDGIDSVDHILMEAELGTIFTRLINVVWFLRDIDMWKGILEKRALVDPEFSNKGMNIMPEFVTERRKLFVKKYPQFNF